MMAAVEDEETQKRGFVVLFHFVGSTLVSGIASDITLGKMSASLLSCLPIKFTSIHICFDDPRFRIMNALLMLQMGRERRVRLRMHYGTHTECRYGLMTFGVPVEGLPLTDDGDIKTTTHMKWIAKRKVKESKLKRSEEFHGIDLPGINDVLVGRGKPIGHFPGNVRLRRYVEQYVDEYEQATKQEKTLIAMRIVHATKRNPCRFLKRNDDGWWEETTDDVARAKVSTCFRSARSSKTAAERQSPVFAEAGDAKRLRVFSNEDRGCITGFCPGN